MIIQNRFNDIMVKLKSYVRKVMWFDVEELGYSYGILIIALHVAKSQVPLGIRKDFHSNYGAILMFWNHLQTHKLLGACSSRLAITGWY